MGARRGWLAVRRLACSGPASPVSYCSQYRQSRAAGEGSERVVNKCEERWLKGGKVSQGNTLSSPPGKLMNETHAQTCLHDERVTMQATCERKVLHRRGGRWSTTRRKT